MARELTFKLAGSDYSAVPLSLGVRLILLLQYM